MSPSSPRVSIGLPVYNGETYLGLAIDSILVQTFTDFELVICDNCSTDRTQEICERYAKQDERVRYYRNPKNLGAGPNYDRTFELSTGEYFKWMAHDDLIGPEFLEKCVAALDADPEAVLCHARVELIDAEGEVTASYDPGLSDSMSNRLSDRFSAVIIPVHMGTDFFGVIRRTALEGSPLHGKYPGSDQTLLAVLALRGRYLLIQEHLFQNRAHAARYSDGVSYKDRAEWFAAENKNKTVYALWTQYREYCREVRRHQMSGGDRARCYWHLFRWWFIGFNTPRMLVDVIATHFPAAFDVARKIKRRFFGLTDLGFDWERWRGKK